MFHQYCSLSSFQFSFIPQIASQFMRKTVLYNTKVYARLQLVIAQLQPQIPPIEEGHKS